MRARHINRMPLYGCVVSRAVLIVIIWKIYHEDSMGQTQEPRSLPCASGSILYLLVVGVLYRQRRLASTLALHDFDAVFAHLQESTHTYFTEPCTDPYLYRLREGGGQIQSTYLIHLGPEVLFYTV